VATIEATICDQSFHALADIVPSWESVAWRLNGIGMARFNLPYVDAACRRDYLREGNGLYLRFSEDVGLPAWGGVLDLPQDQDEDGITQSAYSGEYILTWRETGLNRLFSATAPGMIFKGLIDDANGIVPTGITIDTIYTGGTAIDKAYHFHELFRQSQELSDAAGPDFAVIPAYSGGVLSFKANWYERRGQDSRGKVYLVEGKNVSKARLTRQGNLANHIEMAGNGASWGPERYVKSEDDAEARAVSGYREWKEVNSSISSQATIDAHAAAKLAELAWPTNAISISVLNEKPSLFADYDVGDLVSCQLFLKSPEWVFEGDIRIMAREWTPSGVELVVQEWR